MKILLPATQIREGVRRLAAELRAVYGDRPVTIVAVLTGSVVFLADLIRHLNFPLDLELVRASSYRGRAVRPGELTLDLDGLPDPAGRELLIVDDIFDTGRTLKALTDALVERGPKSLRTAVLLRKAGRQEVPMGPDFTVFDIPDEFVVGYGLDFDGRYRNFPFVGVLDAADLAAHAAGLPPVVPEEPEA